jgi:hypothetical protein
VSSEASAYLSVDQEMTADNRRSPFLLACLQLPVRYSPQDVTRVVHNAKFCNKIWQMFRFAQRRWSDQPELVFALPHPDVCSSRGADVAVALISGSPSALNKSYCITLCYDCYYC